MDIFYIVLSMSELDLKKVRKALKLTQEELADKLEVHYKTIQNWEKGKTISEAKMRLIRELVNQSGKVVDYSHPADHLNAGGTTVNEQEVRYVAAWPSDQVFLLPLSARSLEINLAHFRQFGVSYEKVMSPVKGADFATVLSGDGLGPEFPDGAIVFFKRIDPDLFIEWGKVHAVSTRNGLIIKRLNEGSEPGRLRCSAADPLLSSFEIPRNGVDLYFYKAVACTAIK